MRKKLNRSKGRKGKERKERKERKGKERKEKERRLGTHSLKEWQPFPLSVLRFQIPSLPHPSEVF